MMNRLNKSYEDSPRFNRIDPEEPQKVIIIVFEQA